jgi:hypothetical protein
MIKFVCKELKCVSVCLFGKLDSQRWYILHDPLKLVLFAHAPRTTAASLKQVAGNAQDGPAERATRRTIWAVSSAAVWMQMNNFLSFQELFSLCNPEVDPASNRNCFWAVTRFRCVSLTRHL